MKMTYPGLVLLVGVGVGIATFLYYMFTENNRSEEQYYSRSRRSSDGYRGNCFALPHSAENALLRRSSSNGVRSIDRRDLGTNREDINRSVCSICQFALIDSDVIQLRPCRHHFHKECINELTKFDPGALCPNCRRKFRSA